ncbi:AraC family transcriptional regulator [Adhaeribacter arboris]|uniref:AraC family transcriptional regulator n=1 Tax=Adhaeribacter arboris TaxID=2072846 RepID=A0A2T2YGQ5_9BACT|nr:GyrI-like domain-containing protein [Adhaeribacter arboris]PSR54683.1 AraC family transcriptional regulator [Adhaeribacter arboris]
MVFETVPIHPFYIIGISVRTTNQNGQAQADIGELWGRFLSQNLISQIPNKESNVIYCVYTDYESDYQGPYTTILGCRVSSLEAIPPGFTGITIPAATYQVYTSQGKLPECVGQTWNYIWQNAQNRKYSADFDVYDSQSQTPESATVKTYLSVN